MKTRITVNEAIRLVPHTPVPIANNAVAIVEAYVRSRKLSEAEGEERDIIAHSLIWALYNAGRIDGIRSERARRRGMA